jgi:hypothetical protein
MKAPAFKYVRAETLEEALGYLVGYGDDARVIAGGQSLLPMMNMRVANPEVLVDINGLDALRGISLIGGKLRIGALARHCEVLASADFDTVEALQSFADERDLTLLQIAIGGLAAMPAVGSVIAGATKVSQIEANVAAGLWEPSADELLTLMELTA